MAGKLKTIPWTIRPNVKRQIILVVLALAGLGIGYGVGFVARKNPPADVAQNAAGQKDQIHAEAPETARDDPNPVLPEADHNPVANETVRAYEEALPHNIVEGILPTPPAPPIIPPPNMPSTGTLATAPKPHPSEPSVSEPSTRPPVSPPAEQDLLASGHPGRDKPGRMVRQPTWQNNALPFRLDGRPAIAIIIDDMGVDRRRSARIVALRPPLTLSYLTYGRDLKSQTMGARQAGHELLMHIPMEPSSTAVDPGPNVLLSGMPKSELLQSLRWDLAQFDGYVGINNHMGSRFTADLPGMQTVMSELANRGLIFLDSLTSPRSKGSQAASAAGIPHLTRNVFLDHVDDLTAIRKRLQETENLARRQGHVIAIGHPRDNTLAALTPWIKTIEGRGFQLVPLTALLKPDIGPVAGAN